MAASGCIDVLNLGNVQRTTVTGLLTRSLDMVNTELVVFCIKRLDRLGQLATPSPPNRHTSLSFVMLPLHNHTTSWPAKVDGNPVASASDKDPCDNRPLKWIQEAVEHHSVHTQSSPRLPGNYVWVPPRGVPPPLAESAHDPDRAFRGCQPVPEVQIATETKQKESQPSGPTILPIQSAGTLTSNPSSTAQTVAPAQHQPASPPGPSHQPVKFAPILTPTTSHSRGPLVNAHPVINHNQSLIIPRF